MIYAEAMTARSIPDEQARYFASIGANTLASAISKRVDAPPREEVERTRASVERTLAKNPEMLAGEVREVERVHGNRLVGKRAQVIRTREALENEATPTSPQPDGGYEF